MNLEIRFRLPNQEPQTFAIQERALIGTLLSNDIVLRTRGVEPIHAMIEVWDDTHVLTDLGSKNGVMLNGNRVDVEAEVQVGDTITIGDVKLDVLALGASEKENFHSATTDVAMDLAPPKAKKSEISKAPSTKALELGLESDFGTISSPRNQAPVALETAYVDSKSTAIKRQTVASSEVEVEDKDDRIQGEPLFSPKNSKPSGDVLEVVSYWGDTVLDVELFHPSFRGYERVTLGTPPKTHFLAGGKEPVNFHVFADISETGYRLRLIDGMHARMRKAGKLGEKKGKSSISLGSRDIAHVAHGPIKYFFMFVKPPGLYLPKKRAKDPFFVMLMSVALFLYLVSMPLIYFSEGKSDNSIDDDIWSIVNMPEKPKQPEPEITLPKPVQQVAEVKTPPPQPKPPKPMAKPPKPVKPEEPPKPPKKVEKPKQTKPVARPTQSLAKAESQPKKLDEVKKDAAGAGMVSTGAKRPNFKAPGKDRGGKVGLAGGARGGGKPNPAAGGARKGNRNMDVMGAEGGAPGKASGVNLSQLGLGAGKILKKAGPGAVATDFKSSAGGAGGGAGSASKTYGLGGPGAGRTLGVSGAGGAVNNFGGFGGEGSGQGGSGGLGGAGIGKGFGRRGGSQGRADVQVPPGDPVVSGGLTQQEVAAVIRANLNQIRHCYEQLLQRSPNTSGKISVNFVINSSGSVASASIQNSSISDSIMQGCVTGKVRRWRFPQPRGGQSVEVNYPFVFNPL